MAWETLIPLSSAYRDGNRPRIALMGMGQKRLSPEIAIRLSKDAVEALGAKIGDTVHVSRGVGPDDGWIRLAKDGARGFRVRGNNKHARPWLGFAAWPECGRVPRPAEMVDWEIVGKGIIKLKLPAWAAGAAGETGPVMQRERPRIAAV